ncbi:MAG: hypothetical protein ABIZ91_05045 [Gemmatimonadaceae bacterium]
MNVRRAGPPVFVAIDPSIAPSLPGVRYALRTLLHTAGFSTRLQWHQEGMACDLYYGPRRDVSARVTIPSVSWNFADAPRHAPTSARDDTSLAAPVLVFPGEPARETRADTERLDFPTDCVFASYWLLTGAAEPGYPRSRFDDLDLDASVLVREGLLARPIVSLYADVLRRVFDPEGSRALPWAWEGEQARFAFAFSHDVDYPEIIRPIEVLRVLAARGRAGVGLAARVATGRSHFWTFAEWVELAARYGTRPCFYFMARQGSLLQYAMGTPDDFYDVRAPRFQRLFTELRDAGCEIGLHASFHAHRSAETLRHEVQRIADAAGGACRGNRHHYWHLDPSDPNETLRRHGEAGLAYDSSLGLEYYPGFRRGICHPFRVFHPGTTSELPTVQLPPAWMDDHFDRRLARNHIADRDAAANALLAVASATRGIVVVDYHSRGMNADFYPHYGPWLTRFAEANFDDRLRGMTPSEILDAFLERETALAAASADETRARTPPAIEAAPVRLPDLPRA